MIYEWGSRSHAVSAQVVGETVEDLARRHGGLCPPSALVQAAKAKKSPLHDLFTWDDQAAAGKWRVHEARQVINSLRVVMEDSTDRPPAFISVSVMDEDEPKVGYSPFMTVVQNDEMREDAIADAKRYLAGFRRRFAHLDAFSKVVAAIDELDLEDAEAA